jgi:hypothetical protein
MMSVELTVYLHEDGRVRIADHPPGSIDGWKILYTFQHQVKFPD